MEGNQGQNEKSGGDTVGEKSSVQAQPQKRVTRSKTKQDKAEKEKELKREVSASEKTDKHQTDKEEQKQQVTQKPKKQITKKQKQKPQTEKGLQRLGIGAGPTSQTIAQFYNKVLTNASVTPAGNDGIHIVVKKHSLKDLAIAGQSLKK